MNNFVLLTLIIVSFITLLFATFGGDYINPVGDEEYFGITNNEKWDDLRNEQAIEAFTLFHGYDKYRMIRYSNGEQFYNNDVVNPLDAYILMETINGDTKKAEYREYKEWLLNIERMNAGV